MKQYKNIHRLPTVGILVFLLGACTFEMPPNETAAQGTVSIDAGTPNVHSNTGSNTTPVWSGDVVQPAIALVAGADHACALAASGEVTCWGNNDFGQLGYGHTEAIGDDEPVAWHGSVDVGDWVVGLTAGRQHTCAILEKGSIRCWGYGGDLALGNGNGKYHTVGDDEVPGEVKDAIIYSNSPFSQLAAGDHHTCMLTELGSIKCWGNSPEGALGYGYATQTGGWLGNVPLGDTASFIVAGSEHTCAIVDGGKIRCWGEATSLGYGGEKNIGDDEKPSKVSALWLGETAVQIAAGDRHTCALTVSGAVRCWGQAKDGVLGYADNMDNPSAEEAGIVKLGGATIQIAAGKRHTCALLLDGTVRCWGEGSYGALGYGNTQDIGDDEVPSAAGAVALPEPVVQLVAGDGFTCALLNSGAVQCWGSGLDGRLGYGHEQTIGDDETPASRLPILPFGN